MDQADSQFTIQKRKTPDMKTEKKVLVDQQKPYTEEDVANKTQLKLRVEKVRPNLTDNYGLGAIPKTSLMSDIPLVSTTPRYPPEATTEASATMRIPSQGRLST